MMACRAVSEGRMSSTACHHMGWLRLVGSLKLLVFFAKEPYKRDNILQKRPIILRSLLIVATPYIYSHYVLQNIRIFSPYTSCIHMFTPCTEHHRCSVPWESESLMYSTVLSYTHIIIYTYSHTLHRAPSVPRP